MNERGFIPLLCTRRLVSISTEIYYIVKMLEINYIFSVTQNCQKKTVLRGNRLGYAINNGLDVIFDTLQKERTEEILNE